VKLIIADDGKGLKAAAAKVLGATIQRCRVHFMRNALASVGKKDKAIVTAALRAAFEQDTLASAKAQWAKLIDVFHTRGPKLADLMVRAEDDVLAYKTFPKSHWRQIHSTDEMDKHFLRYRRMIRRARTTSWRRTAQQLKAPPGCLTPTLPA